MNKGELVDVIAGKTNITKKQVDQVLTATLDSIVEALQQGDKVTLVGFGTFERRDRAARTGRNPQNGEPLEIPATTVPAFVAGKQFKEAL